MTNLRDQLAHLTGPEFMESYRAIQRDMLESVRRRRSIIKFHADFHQNMEPKPGRCGLIYEEIVTKCPVCKGKYAMEQGS